MIYQLAADGVVLLHLAFIVFVVPGGVLLIRWRWLMVLHLPAVIWAALLEFNGWICPLTPLENQMRTLAGEQGYSGGFVEHYIVPVIYPQGLTSDLQIMLGLFVVLINLLVYAYILVVPMSSDDKG